MSPSGIENLSLRLVKHCRETECLVKSLVAILFLSATSPTRDHGRNKQHVGLAKRMFINITVISTLYNKFKM